VVARAVVEGRSPWLVRRIGSIALHTTRQVTSYMQSEVRLVALGVQYDVLGSPFDTLTAEQRDAVLAAHPRDEIQDRNDRGARGGHP
jgi:hypothetical protein